MNLSQVRIENMHGINRTYCLKGLNYFVGPNGAGKSTVLQAVQLALLGYIPGYDKNKSSIFQHASAPHMSVELTIKDDSDASIVLRRSWIQKGKDIVATAELPDNFTIEKLMGGLELPVFNFTEFIGMSANKLKDWFINFLPATSSTIDWAKELNASIADFGKILDPEYVTDTIAIANTTASGGVESIRTFNSMLKDSLSAKKAEYTRLQSTVNSLIHYDDCDDSLDESAIRAEIDAKNARLYAISSEIYQAHEQEKLMQKCAASKAAAPADSVELDERFKSAMKLRQESADNLSKIEPTITKTADEILTITTTIRSNGKIISGGGLCSYTNAKCDSVVAMLDKLKADNEELFAKSKELSAKLAELNAERSKLSTSITHAENTIRQISACYSTKHTDIEAYDRIASVKYDATKLQAESESINTNVKCLTDQLTQVVANKKYEALQSKLTADMYATQQIVEMLKVWIKLTDVNGLQSNMMAAPFAALASYMTEDLQTLFSDNTITADFNLTERANSFHFGITLEHGTYVPYNILSSGEKCLFVFALFASLMKSSGARLPMILVDDLLDHLDDKHINSLFNYLDHNKSLQVIIAGVKPCLHENAAQFVVEV